VYGACDVGAPNWGVPVLNWIWLGLILIAVVTAAFTGQMQPVYASIFDTAKSSIDLVIKLVGGMIFFLGLTRVAFDGGLRDWIARALGPVLRRLFPDVPPDHPAMGSMVMNMASNIMGMGNAATPFGLKAMKELASLNHGSHSASNAMVLFVAINTSAITLMAPSGTMMVRAAAGSTSPGAIWLPTLIATTCSTVAAVGAYFLLRNLSVFRWRPAAEGAAHQVAEDETPEPGQELPATPSEPWGPWQWIIIGGSIAALGYAVGVEALRVGAEAGAAAAFRELANVWAIPLLVAGLLLIGVSGRVRVYDSMIEGGREGLQVAVTIAPYLVAILVAVAMFRASGALDVLISWIDPITSVFGVPPEVLPMALLRPLSGSGAFGVMSETLEAYGPASFLGLLTSTLQGSTETTFYVLALYLGAARVTDGRHAIFACLIGDVAGFVGAVAACHWFFS
jgi:spore maturation protein SpmA